MKPPLIPFVPLILKGEGSLRAFSSVGWGPSDAPQDPPHHPLSPPDLTFLHEGSKTLLDGLVNVEKLVGSRGEWGRGTPRMRGGNSPVGLEDWRTPSPEGLGLPCLGGGRVQSLLGAEQDPGEGEGCAGGSWRGQWSLGGLGLTLGSLCAPALHRRESENCEEIPEPPPL